MSGEVKPWGCWNKPRKRSYEAIVRDYCPDTGKLLGLKVIDIEDRGSLACPYDHRPTDQRCVGCKDPWPEPPPV